MDANQIISIILAVTLLIAVSGSLLNRIQLKKGIGWQFIRLNTILGALLLAAILSLSNALTEGPATILALALGYAFGKDDKSGDKSDA